MGQLGTERLLLIKWVAEGAVKGFYRETLILYASRVSIRSPDAGYFFSDLPGLVFCDVLAYVSSREYVSISQSVRYFAVNQGGTTGIYYPSLTDLFLSGTGFLLFSDKVSGGF